jgi:hypothetical protein
MPDLLPQDFEKLTRNRLRENLSAFIKELLLTNPDKLANLMYRHDVKQHLFQTGLLIEDVDEQALFMADLVIDREWQKVASRAAYKKEKEEKINRQVK